MTIRLVMGQRFQRVEIPGESSKLSRFSPVTKALATAAKTVRVDMSSGRRLGSRNARPEVRSTGVTHGEVVAVGELNEPRVALVAVDGFVEGAPNRVVFGVVGSVAISARGDDGVLPACEHEDRHLRRNSHYSCLAMAERCGSHGVCSVDGHATQAKGSIQGSSCAKRPCLQRSGQRATRCQGRTRRRRCQQAC